MVGRAILTATLAVAAIAMAVRTAKTAPDVIEQPASAIVLKAGVLDSLNQGIDLSRLSTKPGVHIVPLEQSAFRGELAQSIRREIRAQAIDGAYTPTDGNVPDLRATVDAVKANGISRFFTIDRTYRTVEAARPHLRYEPASVAGTQLASALLREVATGGQIDAGRWSGVTRTWDLAGVGTIRLDESEYRETGGSITIIEEWLNAKVKDAPASLKTMRSPTGKTLVSIAWVTDSTSYRLDLQPIDAGQLRANEDVLLAIANTIGTAP